MESYCVGVALLSSSGNYLRCLRTTQNGYGWESYSEQPPANIILQSSARLGDPHKIEISTVTEAPKAFIKDLFNLAIPIQRHHQPPPLGWPQGMV